MHSTRAVPMRGDSPPSPTPRRPSDPHGKYLAGTNLAHRLFPRGVTSLTVDIPSQRAARPTAVTGSTLTASPEANQVQAGSRWRTKEFYAYYLVFSFVVPKMWMAGVEISRESNPNYYTYAHRLSPGWLFGWKVDTSDHQWLTIRSHLPLLGILALVWVGLASTFNLFFHGPAARSRFIVAFAIALLAALHGSSLPKILLILWINYKISQMAMGEHARWTPVATWAFNIGVLFANEIFEGYKWGHVMSGLSFLDEKSVLGLLPRWHISWNITMLRLISFNMDRYWAAKKAARPPIPTTVEAEGLTSEKPESAALAAPTERARAATSHPLTSYSFMLYLAYALYPPLYLAGPIMTYNAFLSQLYSPPTVDRRTVVSYAMRFLACLFTMELVTHSMYVVAIKDESRSNNPGSAWDGATPFQLSMVGFWNLIIVWLKLLIPWRVFRLWALLDGMDPPENMVRCMANNYSTTGFWRSWHRSYNLWTVRYLYIPLGGSSRAVLSTLAVFTFVALWHDLSLKLLTWGWVITLFVLPEMLCQKVISYRKYGHTSWYRHLAAFGGVLNVLMMMTANLIGFAIGTEGMTYMWQQMVGSWQGIQFMIVASLCLFVAVQVMFEYREEERRNGISRKC